MAKSWKSFIPKTENQLAEQELLEAEKALKITLEDLAKTNDELQKVLKEREGLEAKMQQILNPQASNNPNEDPRFGSVITSFEEKRKQDAKNFHKKRLLETKIASKNKEISSWEEKRKALKSKIEKVKSFFERKKKQTQEIQNKVTKLKDDFDYNKQRERVSKKIDDFPFTENKLKKKITDFTTEKTVKKPKEKFDTLKSYINIEPKIKKIKDKWSQIRDAEREALSLKNTFEKKQNKLQALKEKTKPISKIKDTLHDKRTNILENPKKEKNEEDKKKTNPLERFNSRVKDNFENDNKVVKEKEEKPKERKSLWEKREERQQKRREEQMVQNKETSKREKRREQRQEERKNRKKDKFN